MKETVEQVKALYKQKIPELSTVIGYIKAEILDKAKEKLFVKYFADDEKPGAQNFMRDREKREITRKWEGKNMLEKEIGI